MTLVVTHSFVSPKPQGSDSTRIYGPQWNANHQLNGTADASQLNSNVVQGITNDTNITGSITGQVLTLGWTGTLAAARLNGNVVQAVTNDTNITGSISGQTLTLSWTGTLAAGRLNANVVQSVTNDTNVTGSISAQNLTLGWTGTLANSRLANMAAYTLKGNATGSAAAPSDFTIDSLTAKASPVSTDEVLLWDVAGAAMKKATVAALAAGGGTVPTVGVTNGKFVESHVSNAVTFALKTLAGADPSAGSPVTVYFPDGTSITQTAALSVTISSGSTLGATSAIAFRVWLCLINNAGSLVIGVRNCSNASGIFGFPGNGVLSTSADNGAGNATSAGVTYTQTTAYSSKAFIIAGFADYESGLATAGTWNASPTRVQNWYFGIPRPGEPIQSVSGSSSTGTTNTTTSWVASGVSVAITPTSACNPITIECGGLATMNNPSAFGYVGILRGGNLIGFDLLFGGGGTTQNIWTARQNAMELPNTTSAVTYAVGVKAFTSGTGITYPSTSAASDAGWITASELMG